MVTKTKSTKTTNSRITKRLQSLNTVGTTIATRANHPMEGEPNDVKVKRPKIAENMQMMNTTLTGESGYDAEDYDKMQTHAPSDRPYDPVFEYVTSGQEDRKADGRAIIPEWQPTTVNINDPHATTRTDMTLGTFRGTVNDKAGTLPVPSYHKSPGSKTYTEADNQAISMMSTGSVSIHSPISSGINTAG